MTKSRTLTSSITLLQEAVMWLRSGACFLMHYIDYRCAENAVSLASASHSVCFSVCVLQLWHPVECISFSLSLTASPSVAQRAVFMRVPPDVDSTVEQMTDLARSWGDKSTVQHSAGFHLAFSLPALFTYVCLCLTFSFLLAPYQCSDFFFLLDSAWHIRMDWLQTESQTHSLSLPFVFEYWSWFPYKA